MLKFKDLSDFQQRKIIDYIVQHDEEGIVKDEEFQHDGVRMDVEFPETFFVSLREEELDVLAAEAREEDELMEQAILEEQPGEERRSLAWLQKVMEDVYSFRLKKYEMELKGAKSGGKKLALSDDLSVHLFQMLSKRYGMGSLVKKAGIEVLDAVKRYRNKDHEVQLFGALLCSAAYDTIDVELFLARRKVLMPFTFVRHDVHVAGSSHATQRRYIHSKDIPGLLRRCLPDKDGKECGVFTRCRHALNTFCDSLGRFPALVDDPNFYTPPFTKNNPYLGTEPFLGPQKTPDESRWSKMDTIVEVTQLYWLLLVNQKQERMTPLKARPRPRSTSPVTGGKQRSRTPLRGKQAWEQLATPKRKREVYTPPPLKTPPKIASKIPKYRPKGPLREISPPNQQVVADMPLDLMAPGSPASPSLGPETPRSSIASPKSTALNMSGAARAMSMPLEDFDVDFGTPVEENDFEESSPADRRKSLSRWMGSAKSLSPQRRDEDQEQEDTSELEAKLHRMVGSFINKY